jgi:CHRD domain
MRIRYVWAAPIAAALVAGLVSCGGGGGGSTPAPTYTVGGTISGSAGVTLRINGGGDYPVSALGAFTIPTGLTNGTAYAVTVTGNAQPCAVTNGTGTMGSSNITNVVVTCTTVVRSAALNGASENPPNNSGATGSGAVLVNPTTREITGGITFTGLVATAHHIHIAPAGNPTGNGGVVVGLDAAPDGVTATIPAGTTLTPAQYTAFLAGELYFNVHSANNLCPPAPTCSAGEIRGQINVVGGVSAGLAALSAASEVPAGTSTATGRGTIVFNSTTGQVLIAYVTHNVANPTAAHVHTGAPGANGGVTLGLTQGTNLFFAPNPSTFAATSNFNAGNTYFNVHSQNNLCAPAATCGAGEIRGQIAVQ